MLPALPDGREFQPVTGEPIGVVPRLGAAGVVLLGREVDGRPADDPRLSVGAVVRVGREVDGLDGV